MRPNHTVTDLAQPHSILVTPLEAVDESSVQPSPGITALGRVTFCFAWLFGLEAFLAGAGSDAPRSGRGDLG